MLYIDRDHPDVKFAEREHYKSVRCLIWKKTGATHIDGTPKTCGGCQICASKIEVIRDIPNQLLDIFNDDFLVELLICSFPENLIDIDRELWKKVFPGLDYHDWISPLNKKIVPEGEKSYVKVVKNIYQKINEIIAYDNWFVPSEPSRDYSAYHLSTYLGIRSCIYCNRNYTISEFKVDRRRKLSKLIRPQFDHWFPQQKFPFLALSFYNLIPSCSICNSSIKSRKEFELEKHMHPYINDNIDDIKFGYTYEKSVDYPSVELVAVHSDRGLEAKIQSTLNEFHLKELYNGHRPELLDLIKLREAYSDEYLDMLKRSFPEIGLTKKEVYRIIFGVEMEKEHFHRRPFSKFKYDILSDLKII